MTMMGQGMMVTPGGVAMTMLQVSPGRWDSVILVIIRLLLLLPGKETQLPQDEYDEGKKKQPSDD